MRIQVKNVGTLDLYRGQMAVEAGWVEESGEPILQVEAVKVLAASPYVDYSQSWKSRVLLDADLPVGAYGRASFMRPGKLAWIRSVSWGLVISGKWDLGLKSFVNSSSQFLCAFAAERGFGFGEVGTLVPGDDSWSAFTIGLLSAPKSGIVAVGQYHFPYFWFHENRWAPGKEVAAGQVVRQWKKAGSFSRVYQAGGNGTTGATEPTWPSSGTVVDNDITWTAITNDRQEAHGREHLAAGYPFQVYLALESFSGRYKLTGRGGEESYLHPTADASPGANIKDLDYCPELDWMMGVAWTSANGPINTYYPTDPEKYGWFRSDLSWGSNSAVLPSAEYTVQPSFDYGGSFSLGADKDTAYIYARRRINPDPTDDDHVCILRTTDKGASWLPFWESGIINDFFPISMRYYPEIGKHLANTMLFKQSWWHGLFEFVSIVDGVEIHLEQFLIHTWCGNITLPSLGIKSSVVAGRHYCGFSARTFGGSNPWNAAFMWYSDDCATYTKMSIPGHWVLSVFLSPWPSHPGVYVASAYRESDQNIRLMISDDGISSWSDVGPWPSGVPTSFYGTAVQLLTLGDSVTDGYAVHHENLIRLAEAGASAAIVATAARTRARYYSARAQRVFLWPGED